MSQVKIFEQVDRKRKSWEEYTISVDELLKKEAYGSKPTFIFVERSLFTKNESQRNRLSSIYRIPLCFWTDTCQRLQGYFGCEDRYDDQNKKITGHASWFHFEVKYLYKNKEEENSKLPLYHWFKMAFFVSWTYPDNAVVICFNVVEMLQERLFKTLRTADPIQPHWDDPYSVQLVIVEAVVTCYNTAVWSLRDAIRRFEEIRRGELEGNIDEPDFTVLHELARHTLHKTETLGVAVETLRSMTEQQKGFHDDNDTAFGPTCSKIEVKKTRQYLLFQLQMLKSLEARAKANDARIRNEITLAFNTVAQRDSRTSAAINVSTQSDSVTMKAIAVLTMFFLPSMFVAAIFSMSFFDFSPDAGQTRMSSQFWIYLAITAPLTFATYAVFYVYERWQQHTKLKHFRWLLPSVIYDPVAHGHGKKNDLAV